MTITVECCIDGFQQVFNYVRINKLVGGDYKYSYQLPTTWRDGTTEPDLSNHFISQYGDKLKAIDFRITRERRKEAKQFLLRCAI